MSFKVKLYLSWTRFPGFGWNSSDVDIRYGFQELLVGFEVHLGHMVDGRTDVRSVEREMGLLDFSLDAPTEVGSLMSL